MPEPEVPAVEGRAERDGPQLTPEQVAALAEVLAPALERLAKAAQPYVVAASRGLAELGQQVQRAFAVAFTPEVRARIHSVGERLLPLLEAAEQLRQEALPNVPNPLAYFVVRDLALRDGIPIAWLPDATILSQLLEERDRQARLDVLTEHFELVRDDCLRVLDEVSDPNLLEYRDLLEQAAHCANSAPAPCQALCLQASTFLAGSMLSEHNFARLAQQLRGASRVGLPPVGELRRTLALLPVGSVLENFHPGSGENVPGRPNRHAVAHALSATQYTRENALLSLMLSTSLLRQMQDNLDESFAGPDVPAS